MELNVEALSSMFLLHFWLSDFPVLQDVSVLLPSTGVDYLCLLLGACLPDGGVQGMLSVVLV